jgi:hydrophobic/amphiphilic exporter-1 (mainly G- bacteria), HAE1 family
MKLARLSIDRPVTILMFFLAVVFLGLVSLRELSVDLLPDISYPRLSVMTQYTGVAPEEIETLVTAPLEAAVSGIPGLRRVESISKEGVSYMTLEFAWGMDMDFTMLHTREKLDSARNTLPEDVDNPTIIPLDPQSKPIMVLALSGERSLLELKEFAEDLVKPRLEQIEGIGSAEITGGVEREIQVDINPQLLALYGMTVDEVARRIDAFNRNLQGGTIRKGMFKYAIRVVGEFESVKEIAEISLMTTKERGVIRLRDIAIIKDAIKERQGMTRLDRSEGIGVLVRKGFGANTVKVTRLAKKVIDQVQKENPEIHLLVVSEQAKYIENAISAVINEIVQGAILAFLVLLIFLQEWKTPLIIDTVIPISIIGTFNLLFFSNITLNIMSLGGLALGVGMLDDCAVVVSENIFRHRSEGKGLREAAYIGTKEVGGAVTSTALTTIVVFLPVIYVHGVAGQLFKDTALTVTFSLLSSLFVALTLLPMLESKIFELKGAEGAESARGREFGFSLWRRKKSRKAGVGTAADEKRKRWLSKLSFPLYPLKGLPFKFPLSLVFKGFNFIYNKFVARYEVWLKWSLDHKGRVLAATLIFFAATFGMGALVKRELMPKIETSSFELHLKAPVNYSLEQTAEVVASLEGHLKGAAGVKTTLSQTGIVSGMESLNPDVSLNSAQIYVGLERPSQVESAFEKLRRRLADFPDVQYSIVREENTLAQFLGFSAAEVRLKVKGDNLDKLKDISEELVARLRDVKGIADLSTNIGEGKPEFVLKIRKDALAKYANLSPGAIGDFLVDAVRGRVATQFKEMEEKYDILVRLEERSRENIEALLNEPFPHQGTLIPLRELVTYEPARGPQEIRRENQQREVLVTANLKGAKISQVVPAIMAKIREIQVPANYRIAFGGEQAEMSKSFQSLWPALALAILLTYMIMAAQFESLKHPFLVLFTLPMGAAGAFFALFVTGQTLNVISIIGLVVLVGLVVDDAIVEIDYTNQLRKAGTPLREAVERACRVRLRPILMASLTTVFGLIPMALGVEQGAELLQPLGIVVLAGLLFSTFLTLILIPVLYEWAEKRKEKA